MNFGTECRSGHGRRAPVLSAVGTQASDARTLRRPESVHESIKDDCGAAEKAYQGVEASQHTGSAIW